MRRSLFCACCLCLLVLVHCQEGSAGQKCMPGDAKCLEQATASEAAAKEAIKQSGGEEEVDDDDDDGLDDDDVDWTDSSEQEEAPQPPPPPPPSRDPLAGRDTSWMPRPKTPEGGDEWDSWDSSQGPDFMQLAGSLLGGLGGGDSGGSDPLGGLGGLGGMAGAAGLLGAIPGLGALLGGGGGEMLGGLGNLLGGGGGKMLGQVLGFLADMREYTKDLDIPTIMSAGRALGQMLQNPDGEMDDESKEAIDQGLDALQPLFDKAGEWFEENKAQLEDNARKEMLSMAAKYFEISEDQGNVQEKVLAQVLDPTRFASIVLKGYKMFVTPITLETVPRTAEENESVLASMDAMQGAVGLSMLQEDAQQSTAEIVMGRDYPVEEHIVKTPDDFKLTMYRIPHGKGQNGTKPRPAVFLMHALLDSSASFVAGPTESALAYALADEGYDVWLGNARGNVHSKSHATLSPNSPKFWEWSWDEIATVDIPTMMEYIAANITTPLNFIGHSQGATAGLAALAAKPELATKVNLFVAMAPVVSLKGSTSLLVQSFKDMVSEEQWLKELGSHEVFPHSKISTFVAAGCAMLPAVCTKLLSTMAGGKEENMDTETLSTHLAHTPAGTSVRNLAHWMQFAENDDSASGPRSFKHADGSGGQVYDFSAVNVPTAVYYGEDDAIVPSASVEALIGKLRNVVASKKVPSYGHVDFVWGRDTATALNKDLLATMNARNNLAPPQEPPELPPKPAAEPAAEPAAKPAAEPEPPAASDADCAAWAASGECSSNSAFMKETCLAACEDFFKSCRDVAAAEDCAAWKEAGECTANPEYMAENCAASCGRCAFSEEAGSVPCQDDSEDCAVWAEAGECNNNAEYMASACPLSCGHCQLQQ